jgi:hypothetical protein
MGNKVRAGMRYDEIVGTLGRGYNHSRFGGKDYYLFKGPGEDDYTIAFENGVAVDIREFKKDPHQVYGE